MSLYDVLIDSMTDKGLYIIPDIIERFSASIGGHVLNLCNMDNKMYIRNGIPMNFRIHFIFVAFSGFSKSTYTRAMLRDPHGVLYNDNQFMPVDVHNHFSTASWFGTMDKNADKEVVEREGVFAQYKRGIIGADDYQAIADIFNGTGKSQDEEALLTALDTDEAIKTLAIGKMRIKGVGMTAWFCIRPTVLNLQSGFARRFSMQNFFPSREDAENLKDIARKPLSPNMEYEDEVNKYPMLSNLVSTYDSIKEIGLVTLDYGHVNDWLQQFKISHFNENIYRNLALGFAVAKGEYPKIEVCKEMERLLLSEMEAREVLKSDPFKMMFHHILDKEPDKTITYKELKWFLTDYLQFHEVEAHKLIVAHKTGRNACMQASGTVKQLSKMKLTLDWQPDYIEEMRR